MRPSVGNAGMVGTPLGSATGALPRSGRWTTTLHAARNTITIASVNRCYFMPYRVQRTRAFDRIGIEVTTGAATSVFRLGIYADHTDRNFPGALIVEASGTVDASAAGTPGGSPDTSLAINQTLTPGLYWLACVPQTAVAVLRSGTGSVEGVSQADPAGASPCSGVYQSAVSGALPPNASISNDATAVPLVFLRAV